MRPSKKYGREPKPLDTRRLMGYTTFEEGADGREYKVHEIARGAKEYVCPGCNGMIAIGEKHVVVWTEEHIMGAHAGARERRHWHSSCWRARGRRR